MEIHWMNKEPPTKVHPARNRKGFSGRSAGFSGTLCADVFPYETSFGGDGS